MCVFVLMRHFVNVKARETPRDCELAQTDAQLHTNSTPPPTCLHICLNINQQLFFIQHGKNEKI